MNRIDLTAAVGDLYHVNLVTNSEDICLQALFLLFTFSKRYTKKGFVSSANSSLIGI